MSYANYRQIEKALNGLQEFTGNSARGEMEGHTYYVFSYRTLIAVANLKTGGVAINSHKYSATTSRLQNIIRRAWSDMQITETDTSGLWSRRF